MLYNVSFMLNGVDCANLVDADIVVQLSRQKSKLFIMN